MVLALNIAGSRATLGTYSPKSDTGNDLQLMNCYTPQRLIGIGK